MKVAQRAHRHFVGTPCPFHGVKSVRCDRYADAHSLQNVIFADKGVPASIVRWLGLRIILCDCPPSLSDSAGALARSASIRTIAVVVALLC